MDDYEVRQALAIIKDRVNEVTKEQDWKEKMAEDWNQANAEEEAQAEKPRHRMADDPDLKSQVSYSKYNRYPINWIKSVQNLVRRRHRR